MIKILKNIKSYFYFIPKFFYFFRVFNFNKKKLRPYFGVYFKKSGGPNIRTKRLIHSFGNFYINPNIIYAQSFWNEIEITDAIKYSKKYNVPIIFNQNGVYHNGWYDGDIRQKNQLISLIQKNSDYIFFQSNFCRESSKLFTKFEPKKYKILHNSVPNLRYKKKKIIKPSIFNILISGYFNKKNLYILEPAINSVYKLAKNIKFSPRLIIYGLKTEILKKNLKKKINYLQSINKIEVHKNYNINNLEDILIKIHLAMHLKYKDPCPNAVLERMLFGIPHIISNSGGTPELTGKSSINIEVKDTWQNLIKVDEAKLYEAILIAIKRYDLLRKKTFKQIQKFKWKDYVIAHKKVFLKNIN